MAAKKQAPKFKFLTPAQLKELSVMQDHLNQLTCQANFGHTDWRSMKFNWGLAIVDEVMEIHGHLGWKWWKGSDKYNVGLTAENKKQIQLEVIDILHFGLSKHMQICPGETWEEPNSAPGKIPLTESLEDLVVSASYQAFPWFYFDALCRAVDLQADEIVKIYTGKYTLNIFRQDHGYGDGTYMKQWLIPEISVMYQEDNWYLEKILDDLECEGAKITKEAIKARLSFYYKAVTGGK